MRQDTHTCQGVAMPERPDDDIALAYGEKDTSVLTGMRVAPTASSESQAQLLKLLACPSLAGGHRGEISLVLWAWLASQVGAGCPKPNRCVFVLPEAQSVYRPCALEPMMAFNNTILSTKARLSLQPESALTSQSCRGGRTY